MTDKEPNIININEDGNSKSQIFLIDIIHKFGQDLISAKSENDVFSILVSNFAEQLSFTNCIIYKVENEKKLLKKVAFLENSKIKHDQTDKAIKLQQGQGYVEMVADTGQSLLIPDVSKSSERDNEILKTGSQIVVPVKIHDKVFAVVSSEHPEIGFYNDTHQKVMEIITSLAAGVLVKIHERVELEMIQVKLEAVLDKKSADLDKVVETLSAQYSEMKYQRDKQETLIQEVHHRVTNNLQIISSILRLYINRDSLNSTVALQEIQNRVQVMALIHQNIYKSMEMNLVKIDSYLHDLLSYLKSTSKKVKVQTDLYVEVEHFSLDVLVPLGLYIAEVFYFWVDRASKQGFLDLDFNIELTRSKEDYSFEIKIKDQLSIPLNDVIDIESSNDMNYILISALIDQLEGEIRQYFNQNNYISLKFKTLE